MMAEAESLLDGWLSAEEVIAALLRHLYLRLRGGDLDAAARDAGRARSHVTTSVPASLAVQIDLADAAIAARRGEYDVALPAFERGVAAWTAATCGPAGLRRRWSAGRRGRRRRRSHCAL